MVFLIDHVITFNLKHSTTNKDGNKSKANEKPGNGKQQSSPPQELKQLESAIGRWNVEGNNLSGAPLGANAKVTGEQTFEWMTGNFFLIGRWDRQFDNNVFKGMSVIGYDDSNELSASNYDNSGYMRRYKFSVQEKTWSLTGEKERAIIEFSADGKSFTEKWEILVDGSGWQPLCDLKGVKAK